MQRRNKLFSSQDGRRFKSPNRKKFGCSKLVVDGDAVHDSEMLLTIWVDHFQKLAESQLRDTPTNEKMKFLEMQSHMNEEFLLDTSFTAEEVSRAIAKLKKRKAPGPDGLVAEHLIAGGQAVVIWLMRILNTVVELETIPEFLKRGIVVLVYKGGGKDPMKVLTTIEVSLLLLWF